MDPVLLLTERLGGTKRPGQSAPLWLSLPRLGRLLLGRRETHGPLGLTQEGLPACALPLEALHLAAELLELPLRPSSRPPGPRLQCIERAENLGGGSEVA